MTDIDVELSGPFFDDAVYVGAMRRFMSDATMDIADEGVHDIRANLAGVLKHPTGYYESKIRAQEAAFDTAVINDSDIIYGPWLEGIGSRNFPKTRFPGYFTFKRTTPQLQRSAVTRAERATDRFVEEVN